MADNQQTTGIQKPIGHVPHIKLDHFRGNPGDRGDSWLSWYRNLADGSGWDEKMRCNWMPFHLEDHAKVWYEAQPETTKQDWKKLCEDFKARFNGSDGLSSYSTFLNTKQLPDESCANYFTRFIRASANRDCPNSFLIEVVVNGLLPKIKAIVMPKDLQTLEAVRKAACLAERTVAETMPVQETVASASDSVDMRSLVEEVLSVQSKLEEQKRDYQRPYYHSGSYAPRYEQPTTPQRPWENYQRQQHQQQHQQQQRQPQQQQQQQQRQETQQLCQRCGGRKFHLPQNCPANGKKCNLCGHLDHFRRVCWNGNRTMHNK